MPARAPPLKPPADDEMSTDSITCGSVVAVVVVELVNCDDTAPTVVAETEVGVVAAGVADVVAGAAAVVDAVVVVAAAGAADVAVIVVVVFVMVVVVAAVVDVVVVVVVAAVVSDVVDDEGVVERTLMTLAGVVMVKGSEGGLAVAVPVVVVVVVVTVVVVASAVEHAVVDVVLDEPVGGMLGVLVGADVRHRHLATSNLRQPIADPDGQGLRLFK